MHKKSTGIPPVLGVIVSILDRNLLHPITHRILEAN